MNFKNYLKSSSHIITTPDAALYLLRILAVILLLGILTCAYNFLKLTFYNELSQSDSATSNAFAEADIFFAARLALLKNVSLSVARQSMGAPAAQSAEEVHLLIGASPKRQWSIRLKQRLRDHLNAQQVNLVHVSNRVDAKVTRLYTATSTPSGFPDKVLSQLVALKQDDSAQHDQLWLTGQDGSPSRLYIFLRFDEHDRQSGWLGLEMDVEKFFVALGENNAGTFMMLNSAGMLLFKSGSFSPMSERLLRLQNQYLFGLIGWGWWPDHVVIRKQLRSSGWQLIYSINMPSILRALWPQLLGTLLFCPVSIIFVYLLARRLELRFINPTLERIPGHIKSEVQS